MRLLQFYSIKNCYHDNNCHATCEIIAKKDSEEKASFWKECLSDLLATNNALCDHPWLRGFHQPSSKASWRIEAEDALRETRELANNGEALSCKSSPNTPSGWKSDLQNEMENSPCQDLGRLGEKEWVRPKRASGKEKIKKKKSKKSPEVPGKMRQHGPTMFHYGHVIYFYQPLQSFNKMVVHWIWIHVNSWHQLCITSSRTFKFDFLGFFFSQ